MEFVKGWRPAICLSFHTQILSASMLPALLCLALRFHMLEKASKCDRHVWAMYHHGFDIFGSLDTAE
jgi:hypothetical protein